MELNFENKALGVYRELVRTTRVIQESAESVVPDINDDIGRIASVQTAIYLKSKDITGRGAIVTGEAVASLLYITENEKAVSFLRVTKPFTIEFETPDIPVDAVAQVKLRLHHTEARILNPRKVLINFEIIGDLSCYAAENIISESFIPTDSQSRLHARYENTEISFAKVAMEKTFAINEQYIFPGGKPVPGRIVSHQIEMSVNDSQIIGTKLIIKGNVFVTVCYISDDVNYPVKAEFSSAFSQIVDTGTENLDSSEIIIELTSAYCDLIDTISGDKAADVEIHALLEIVGCKREKITYIADAYSNLMPVQCAVQKKQFAMNTPSMPLKLTADERINVADDCADVLSVFASMSQISYQSEKVQAAVTLDIIYRSVNGSIASVRRLVGLESGISAIQPRVSAARLSDVYLRPDGSTIDAHIAAEINIQSCTVLELNRVESVTLREDEPFDLNEYPSLCLVRAGRESLWELAKSYHSSIEQIAQFNELEEGTEGRLILIPRSI